MSCSHLGCHLYVIFDVSSQTRCHRLNVDVIDVIDDTKVRIWSELECSAASRTELLTSASTTFSTVRCLSHFGFLRARSVAAAEYRFDSAENLRGKLNRRDVRRLSGLTGAVQTKR
jgi:hypothetical protein